MSHIKRIDKLPFLKEGLFNAIRQVKAQSFWDKPDTDVELKVSLNSLDMDIKSFSEVNPQEFEQWKKNVSEELRDIFVEFELGIEFTYSVNEHEIEYKSWVDGELSTEDLMKLKKEISKAIDKTAKDCYDDIQENGIYGPDGLL